MILFFLQEPFGDKHGHVDVFVSRFLETAVQDALDVFPDRVTVRTDDHAALHGRILNEIRLLDNIGIPLREVVLHGGDLRNHLFLLSQNRNFLSALSAPP